MRFFLWCWSNFDWRVKALLTYYVVAVMAMPVSLVWPKTTVVWWTLLNSETSFASWRLIGVKLSATDFFYIIIAVSSLNLTLWILASLTWKEPVGRFFAKIDPILKAGWPRLRAWLIFGYDGLRNNHQRWLLWASAFDRPVVFLLGFLPSLYPVGIALVRIRNITSGWLILYIANLVKHAVAVGVYAISSSSIVALGGLLALWVAFGWFKQSLRLHHSKVPRPES